MLWYGISAGFFTGSMYVFAVPPSPLDANTETLFAFASMNALRSWFSAASPSWNAPSPEPKLCEITSAM